MKNVIYRVAKQVGGMCIKTISREGIGIQFSGQKQ